MVVGFGMNMDCYSSQQLHLAQCWIAQGHQVDLITLGRQKISKQVQLPGLNIIELPGVSLIGGALNLMGGVGRALKRHGPYDFILASEHYQPASAQACLASSKVVIYQGLNTSGSSLPKTLMLKILELTCGRLCRNRALGVVCKTSLAERYIARQNFGHTCVIPCGIDERVFRCPTSLEREEMRGKLGIEQNETVLVYAGNLIQLKDVTTIIDAIAKFKMRSKRPTLLIAGQGPEETPLRGKVQSVGLNGCVRFLGLLPRNELVKHFWASDVLVLASWREIFGLVLLEAMACGLPVLSTPVGGAPDLIEPGKNGFLFPIGDAEALSAHMAWVAEHVKTSGEMGRAASETAMHLTWQNISRRIVDFAVDRVNRTTK